MENELRILPHSDEAEKGFLGSVLLNPNTYQISSDCFYDRRHQILWDKILSLGSWDLLILVERLKTDGQLESVGGYNYLLELQDYASVSGHEESYLDIIKEKKLLRDEIQIFSDGLISAYNGDSKSSEVISKLSKIDSVTEYSDDKIIEGWESGRLLGVPLPWEKINMYSGGLLKGAHTVICGRSGSGKSMLMANIYNHLGSINAPFLACPFEDRYVITKTRMAAAIGKYSWGLIQRGYEWERVNNSWQKRMATKQEIEKAKRCLKSIPSTTHFYDKRSTPKELFGIASRYKAKHGIEAMFIDGAKDIRRPSGKYNDTGFDEEISQELCYIASELDIAVVSVFHLTKIPPNDLITSESIRGSGNIVSDARAVFAFQSKGLEENGVPVEYDDKGNQTTRSFDIVKANHCPQGRVLLETDLRKCMIWEK